MPAAAARSTPKARLSQQHHHRGRQQKRHQNQLKSIVEGHHRRLTVNQHLNNRGRSLLCIRRAAPGPDQQSRRALDALSERRTSVSQMVSKLILMRLNTRRQVGSQNGNPK
jgi:hypothetical protein